MAMPLSRLLLLYDKIDALETEEEMRWLVIVHAGDPKSRMRELQDHLHGISPESIVGPSRPITSEAGFVQDSTTDAILAIRERQQAAAERLRAGREAGASGRTEAGDLPGSLPVPPSGSGE